MADTEDWPRRTETTVDITYGIPEWNEKGRPRRLTANHVHEFKTFMESVARTWWENVDKKKPYKIEEIVVRVRYIQVGVDSDE